MRRTYLWSVPVAFTWPLLQNIIFALRFGHLSADVLGSSLIFVPMGIASAIGLIYLVDRARTTNQKACTVFGYVLASPFAFFGSVLTGILLAPLLGTLIYGTASLIIGSFVGFIVGGIAQSRDLV